MAHPVQQTQCTPYTIDFQSYLNNISFLFYRLHLTNPKAAALLSRLILMSGTIYSTYSYQDADVSKNITVSNELSLTLINKLACVSTHEKYILDCLRQKSVNDLLKAFEQIYEVNVFIYCIHFEVEIREVFFARYQIYQNHTHPELISFK